jgi:hypothetical protein
VFALSDHERKNSCETQRANFDGNIVRPLKSRERLISVKNHEARLNLIAILTQYE